MANVGRVQLANCNLNKDNGRKEEAVKIEFGKDYEADAIGQVLEELGKGNKWQKCVIKVETTSPASATQRLAYEGLKIADFKKEGKRFDLGLEPAWPGPLNWGRKDFFWPGQKDEDGGARKPILCIAVWGYVTTSKKKKK